MSIIKQSLKEIHSEAFEHKLMLNVFLVKSSKYSSFSWLLILLSKFSMSFNRPMGFDCTLYLIQINGEIW